MPRTVTAGPVTFRVYARRSRLGLYVTVRVFGTQRELVRTIRAENRRHGMNEVTESDVQGLMQTHRVWSGRRRRLLPGIGVVNLHRARLGMVVVTHEFGHAMFEWANRKGLWRQLASGDTMPVEERILHAQSEMLRQFMERAEKLRLYS